MSGPLMRAGHRSGERDSRQLRKLFHHSILKLGIERFPSRLLLLAVMPISSADFCRGIFTHREPGLREMTHLQIVWSTRAAHLGRHPPWIDRIAEYIRPASCHGKRERRQVELAFRVRRHWDPSDARPNRYPATNCPRRPGACHYRDRSAASDVGSRP